MVQNYYPNVYGVYIKMEEPKTDTTIKTDPIESRPESQEPQTPIDKPSDPEPPLKDVPSDAPKNLTPTNKQRTRKVWDWERLKQEYIRSDYDTITNFFRSKDICHGTWSRHTTGWKQLQRAHRSRMHLKLSEADTQARLLSLAQLQKYQNKVTKDNYELYAEIFPALLEDARIRIAKIEVEHLDGKTGNSVDLKYLFDLFKICKGAIGSDVKTNEVLNERPSDHIVIDDKAELKNPELDAMQKDFESFGRTFSKIVKRENSN